MPIPTKQDIRRLNEVAFEIPKSFWGRMRVPARFYASPGLPDELFQDKTLAQLVNLATIPGAVRYVMAMPDAHQGYGSPVGGVVVTRTPDGLISPGVIGFDINCGIRLLTSSLSEKDVRPRLDVLATSLYNHIPSGVGQGGRLKFALAQIDKVLEDGAPYIIGKGYGEEQDAEHIEERGRIAQADPTKVSDRAKKRGSDQLGTLGAGNHFAEVQVVEEVYDVQVGKAFGLNKNQVTVMVHCGSRGLGHQTCTDYLQLMARVMDNYNIELPDRELAGVPFRSPEGQNYFKAMGAAANFAFANRQVITHFAREAWRSIFGPGAGLRVVYDVTHNMAKLEHCRLNGAELEVLVHRKGATRAFPADSAGLPARYHSVGQPVLIPGSMGTSSYVLVGTQKALEESFGSTCHGAGRRLSRRAAIRQVHAGRLRDALSKKGIVVRAGSKQGLAEEAPVAYKDVDEVVAVVARAGISRRVARLRPVAVIKG